MSDRALYQQLADELRAAIARGDYQVGDCLPHQRHLAVEYQVAVGTVRKAVGVLEREGLVTPVRHRGTVVRAPLERTVEQRLDRVEKLLEQLLDRLDGGHPGS